MATDAEKQHKLAKHWQREIALSEKAFEPWRNRCKKISDIYTDQRRKVETGGQRRFAILWANIQTLQPAIYSQQPQPAVVRRFKSPDPVARTASEVLERATSYTFDKAKFDDVMRSARDDYLLYGRGQAWFRYEADFESHSVDGVEDTGDTDVVTGERIVIDYVHRNDFGHNPARCWEEVRWVSRRAFMTREELVKRFGELGNEIKLDHEPEETKEADNKEDAAVKKAAVYEIWDRTSKQVYWISKSHNAPLDVQPPLLDIEGFFPCPKPCYGTTSTDDIIPLPDYIFYQDQSEEIDDLTARIGALTDSLKLVGFYPSGEGDGTQAIERAASPRVENELIPVPAWAAFSERGGANAIQWWPVEQVVKVLEGCLMLRKQLIDDIYQITGISDILRGATEASETATAQKLKAQWGSTRIRDRQFEIQRFARDCARIVAEVVADKFEPQTIQEMTGIQLVPPPMPPAVGPVTPEMQQELERSKKMQAVVQLLRDDKRRGFRVDIETDSTIEPDEQAAKEGMTEFLTAVGGFVQNAMPVAQAQPTLAPMMGEMLKTYVRKFRAGRELEEVIERSVDQLSQAAAQPQEPPPDPKMIEAQNRMQIEGQRIQMDQEKQQIDTQLESQRQSHEQALKAQELQHTMELERARMAQQMQLEELKMRWEMAMKKFEAEENAALRVQESERAAQQAEGEQTKDAEAKQSTEEMGKVLAELTAVIAQMNAPKQITLNRGSNGQVTGAEAAPVLN